MTPLAARSTMVAAILSGSLGGSLGFATQAEARDRAGNREEYKLEVRFEPLPIVRLQPESARLVLDLPIGMLPKPQTWYGLEFDGTFKDWDFDVIQLARSSHRLHHRGRASLGAGFRLVVDDPRRTVRFRMNVLPRAAVAELSF